MKGPSCKDEHAVRDYQVWTYRCENKDKNKCLVLPEKKNITGGISQYGWRESFSELEDITR